MDANGVLQRQGFDPTWVQGLSLYENTKELIKKVSQGDASRI